MRNLTGWVNDYYDDIAWLGLAVILFVAVRMVYEGADQVLGHSLPAIPLLKGGVPVPVAH